MEKEIARLLANAVSENVAGVIQIGERGGACAEWEILIEGDTPAEYHGKSEEREFSGGKILLLYIGREYFVKNIQSPRQVDHWRYAGARVLFDKSGWVCRCMNQAGKRMFYPGERRRALLIKLYDFRVLVKRVERLLENDGNPLDLHSAAGRIFDTVVGIACVLQEQWEPMPDRVLEEALEGIGMGDAQDAALLELLRDPSAKAVRRVVEIVERMYAEYGFSGLLGQNLWEEYVLPEYREDVFRFSCLG